MYWLNMCLCANAVIPSFSIFLNPCIFCLKKGFLHLWVKATRHKFKMLVLPSCTITFVSNYLL